MDHLKSMVCLLLWCFIFGLTRSQVHDVPSNDNPFDIKNNKPDGVPLFESVEKPPSDDSERKSDDSNIFDIWSDKLQTTKQKDLIPKVELSQERNGIEEKARESSIFDVLDSEKHILSPQSDDKGLKPLQNNVFDKLDAEPKTVLFNRTKIQEMGSPIQSVASSSSPASLPAVPVDGLNENEDYDDEEEADWYHDPNRDQGRDDERGPQELGNPGEEEQNNMMADTDDDDNEEEEIDDEFWARFDSDGKNSGPDLDEEKDSVDTILDNEEYERKQLEKLEEAEENFNNKAKPPTAPSNMVLFYTWMIVAVLIIVVGVSAYQAKCQGLMYKGNRHQTRGEDRKRLVDNEYV